MALSGLRSGVSHAAVRLLAPASGADPDYPEKPLPSDKARVLGRCSRIFKTTAGPLAAGAQEEYPCLSGNELRGRRDVRLS